MENPVPLQNPVRTRRIPPTRVSDNSRTKCRTQDVALRDPSFSRSHRTEVVTFFLSFFHIFFFFSLVPGNSPLLFPRDDGISDPRPFRLRKPPPSRSPRGGIVSLDDTSAKVELAEARCVNTPRTYARTQHVRSYIPACPRIPAALYTTHRKQTHRGLNSAAS